VPALRPAKLPSSYGRGRDYNRDRASLLRDSRRLDPYDRRNYYGNPTSPFFYLYLAALVDDDYTNDPLPPQYAAESDDDDDGGMSPLWLLLIIPASLGIGAVGGAALSGGSSSRAW
jgi:hypothetical protein